MEDNRIDAYFFTVGHPNETVFKALSGKRQARIVSISGPGIDRMVAERNDYIRTTIPVRQLYPEVGDQPDVPTMGVVAILCTSTRVSSDVVYALTREIFENEDVFFEFDSASLSVEAQEILRAKAEWLKDNPSARVLIEGHCDERGTNEYNLALGDRRAYSAKAFLTDLGINDARLSIISYGEEQPIDSQSTEEAWAKNRRAHFVIK